jgi:Cu/Ag efflux protein CusF
MNKRSISRSILLLLAAFSLLAACNKQDHSSSMPDSAKMSASPVKEGRGMGILRAIDTAGRTLLLNHGNIPGIMEPMTMSYAVDRPELLSGARVGDSVAFTVQDRGEGDFVVTAIKPIGKQ